MESILKKIPLFKYLSEKDIKEIAPLFQLRSFTPNEVVVWQGEPSDKLYIIKKGIVAVKTIQQGVGKDLIFAYLLQGDTIGEVGVLENKPRSATIVAVNQVEVMYIEREAFLSILNQFSSVAIELARILSKYLMNLTSRVNHAEEHLKIILLFHTNPKTNKSNFPYFLGSTLFYSTNKNTIYFEYPKIQSTPFKTSSLESHAYPHPNGFDILTTPIIKTKPLETPVLIDQLTKWYYNVLINVESIDNYTPFLIEKAKQLIIITTNSEDCKNKIEELRKYFNKYINFSNTSVLIVNIEEENNIQNYGNQTYDYNIKESTELYETKYCFNKFKIPKKIEEVTEILVDRLEKDRQISIYIPTTLDVNHVVDTSIYVKRSMEILGRLFGGATSKIADGVWNSSKVGLVSEKVYIITAYASAGSINLYLSEVIDFVKSVKVELSQEAMAIELDNKMFII